MRYRLLQTPRGITVLTLLLIIIALVVLAIVLFRYLGSSATA